MNGSFPSTHLSLIEAAAKALPNEAMEAVMALYWQPVYRLLRCKFGCDEEHAKDLTQGFFARALEREFLARFDPGKAAFRTYLRMAVERFAANEYAAERRFKRGGGLEFTELAEPASGTPSPEEIFLDEWRRQLFVLAIADLRAECASANREPTWRIFEAYDLAEGPRPSYGELARREGIAETAVTNHLAWARRCLRAMVAARLRVVTSGERELREELRRVWN
jgi:RNA polymerase sigma factor (sigma-70 family)